MNKRIMKKIFLWSIIFNLFWSIIVIAQVNQAVTYFWGGGRFGDKIISYTTAKWISHKFNIPIFLKPFKYSPMLRLGKEEKKYSEKVKKQFRKGVLPIRSEKDVIAHAKDNVIFESRGGRFVVNGSSCVEKLITHLLKDQNFMGKLKYMLQPVVPLPQIELPEDKVTVAVHVRKGGGYDQALCSIQYYSRRELYADKRWPLRFPPEQYYVDQIKKISSLFADKPIFIHIFTDDRNPPKLVDRIKKAVDKDNIAFSYRSKGNAHDVHVIEDFYNMSRFDCLIRASSHFGIASQLLGNHQVIIYPKHFKWVGKKLIIDKVGIVDNRTA